MRSLSIRCLLGVLTLGSAAAIPAQRADGEAGKTVAVAPQAKARSAAPPAVDREIRRGERLAAFGGCHDCHTPKVMTANGPQLDRSRLLSGYPAGASLPAVPSGIVGPAQWGALATNALTAGGCPGGTRCGANL